ncbi:MAG: DNA polymerase III subunit beta [Patescibacteria group bacterium]|nr:DNA polymerase III subunit beta [Patescibacteria group bacterium]
MRLSVMQENLLKSLSLVGRCVSAKQALPVLSNILLQTEDGRLKLCATNLETSITLWLGAKVEIEGSITVPARLLIEFVSSLPNEKIDLDLKDESLTVTCASYSANIAGIAASEFPPIPILEEEPNLLVDPKIFSKAAGQVAFAASADEGRPVLTGVFFESAKGSLNLVATDGYRLTKKTLDVTAEIGEGVVIPARSVSEAIKVASEAEEGEMLKVAVTKSKNQAIFALGNIQLATRLLDGTYPPYQNIIPKSFTTRLVVGVEDFLKSVRAASVFAKDLGNVIRLKLDPKTNRVTLFSATAQLGEGTSSFEASLEGEEVEAAFSSRYLTDTLSALNTTQVSLELNSATSPVVFKPVGEENYLQIIMPVRLQN